MTAAIPDELLEAARKVRRDYNDDPEWFLEATAIKHIARAIQTERNRATEAERDAIEALKYASMGLHRIHDSLTSPGPKQAVGEMVCHFMEKADEALAAIRQPPTGE